MSIDVAALAVFVVFWLLIGQGTHRLMQRAGVPMLYLPVTVILWPVPLLMYGMGL